LAQRLSLALPGQNLLSDPVAETIAFKRTDIGEHLGVPPWMVLAPPEGFIMAPQSLSAAGRPLRGKLPYTGCEAVFSDGIGKIACGLCPEMGLGSFGSQRFV
jgi:hypothetical protein